MFPNNYPYELLQQLHQLYKCYLFLSCITQSFFPHKNQHLSIYLSLFVISYCKQPCIFFPLRRHIQPQNLIPFFFLCFQLSYFSTSILIGFIYLLILIFFHIQIYNLFSRFLIQIFKNFQSLIITLLMFINFQSFLFKN